MQYTAGTITVTNGSATVSGSGTLWSTNVEAGDMLSIRGENVFYQIASVTSDTLLTLSSNYAGTTKSNRDYEVVTDFTSNLSLHEINANDKDLAYNLTYGVVRKLDDILGYRRTAILTTTDATETTIISYTLTELHAYLIEATILATIDTESLRNVYQLKALVHRYSGGSATMQGTVEVVTAIESDSALDADIDVSGNTVRVRVTGKAATTINWKCALKITNI